MAVTIHEQIATATGTMEAAVYAALDAIDSYRDVVAALLADQNQSEDPNVMLVKRFEQFLQRADSMTTTIEDSVLDDLLFCLHRVFAVDLAERGEFI
ncbi:MAG: hypothetical protein ACR2P0_04380 [Acidimicrobiales bacterium]